MTNQLRTSSDIQVCDIRHQDTSRKQAFRLFAEEISHSRPEGLSIERELLEISVELSYPAPKKINDGHPKRD